jgi:hypothetical protein
MEINVQSHSETRPWSWILAAAVGLATAAVSTSALVAEQSHLFSSGSDRLERAQAFVDGSRGIGFATTTQRWFVIDCRNALIFAFSGGLDGLTRDALAQRCLEGSLRITEAVPASSFGWFGAAHAAVALADWPGMNTYLERSFATGLREGWIARYRAELSADNFEHLSEANRAHFQDDLILLAGNMWNYRTFLAGIYVEQPHLRETLIEAVEQQSADDQRRFLNSTRDLTAASAN